MNPYKFFQAVFISVMVILSSACGATQTKAASCADAYNYTLGVQPQEDGYWLSFKNTGALPVEHVAGDKVLMLAVRRIDSAFLQVDVGFIADGHLKSFFMKVAMDESFPTRFARTFKPTPQLPVFAIELDPVCSPA